MNLIQKTYNKVIDFFEELIEAIKMRYKVRGILKHACMIYYLQYADPSDDNYKIKFRSKIVNNKVPLKNFILACICSYAKNSHIVQAYDITKIYRPAGEINWRHLYLLCRHYYPNTRIETVLIIICHLIKEKRIDLININQGRVILRESNKGYFTKNYKPFPTSGIQFKYIYNYLKNKPIDFKL